MSGPEARAGSAGGRRRRQGLTLLLTAFLVLLSTMPAAQAQDPKVRLSLAKVEEIWVGQRVILTVELLVSGYFTDAPAFDLPTLPGLLLTPPEDSPVVGNEDLGGLTYTVQRHELSIFSRRAGDQTIPPFTARFHYKRQPLDKEVIAVSLKTEALHFTAKVPPGAEKLGSLLSARDLSAVETWTPAPAASADGKEPDTLHAKAGDAFTRTVTYSAPEMPGMAFPPFPAAPVDGLGLYPKTPEILDRNERGSLSGGRRDAVTYVCQRPGTFVIPAARLTWYDLDAGKLQTIDFPAKTLIVVPNPALAAAEAAAASAQESATRWKHLAKTVLPGSAAALFLLWLLHRRRAALARAWRNLTDPLRPVRLQPLNPPPAPAARRQI